MTSMIERVARAIFAESHKIGNTHGDLDALMPEVQGVFTSFAKGAIEALREPSPAMHQAVAAQWGRRTWSQYNDVIDAALKEPTT